MDTPPLLKLSWICPILVFALVSLGKNFGLRVIMDFGALFLIVAGFIAGIIALFGMSKYGKKGILAPALIGIVINGLLLSIFVTNFIAARARALQRRSDAATSAAVTNSNR
ncbi:MAG: hypothetical protein V4710_24330 [Verrucomicrobiota bacterium]